MDPRLVTFRAEFLALETLVVGLMRGLIATNPSAAEVLQQKGNRLAEELKQRSFPQLGPEQSDAYSAELQEAWERLMQRVMS